MYETEQDIQKQVELAKQGKFWTQEFYNNAYYKVKHKYPIVVPSYNNPNNHITKNFINKFTEDYNWPVYMIIRKSQEEEYLKYNDKKYLIAIPDEEIDNIVKVRNKILDLFDEQIFVFDDDIRSFTYSIAATYANDSSKYRSKSLRVSEVKPLYIIAMWQLMHEIALEHNISISTLVNTGFGFNIRHTDVDKSLDIYSGLCSQVVCLNVPLLKQHNIRYRDTGGHEDFDIQFLCLEQQLPTVIFNFISYAASPMKPSFNGQNTLKERFAIQANAMKQDWGDIDWVVFRTTHKGLDNVGVNWNIYRKKYGVGQKLNGYEKLKNSKLWLD